MKKKQKKSQMVLVVTLSVFSLGLMLAVAGMSQAVVNIKEEAISKTPEAILASTGLESGADINLQVAYYDQKSDACVNMYDAEASKALEVRQFEWTGCDYYNKQLEQGLVDYILGKDYLPVAVGGDLLPNRGLNDMERWFSSVEGKSKEYTGSLKLVYRAEKGAEFSYVDGSFYPLDAADFSAGDSVNSDGHNHLFTMSFAVPFTVAASGAESFEITADDDTFVYIGNQLVLDMGGVHEPLTGKLAVNELGEVYAAVNTKDLAYSGVTLDKDAGAVIRIFHADRDSAESVFKIRLKEMKLNVVQAELASGNGVQVAYDPSDPGYVGPLGETSVFRPDGTKGYIVMATVMGVVVVVCAMFVVMLAHTLVKNRQNKK